MSYADFENRIARINDILCTLNLLAWDSRTMMPPGGIDARAEQVTTLTTLAREMATGDDMARAIDGAKAELAGVDAGRPATPRRGPGRARDRHPFRRPGRDHRRDGGAEDPRPRRLGRGPRRRTTLPPMPRCWNA